ncbi:hypothetical protein DFH09DRAFT_1121634 [Mycena vulgaris]|nr:hypothetical protein DFH09DRAFT_1121634 [Mycena vulgaris]
MIMKIPQPESDVLYLPLLRMPMTDLKPNGLVHIHCTPSTHSGCHRRIFFFLLRGIKKPAAEDMYNARLYYWDPELLVAELKCLNCSSKLHRHGYTRPRRVVDLHNYFYMIGQRHLCPKCTNPTTGKKNCDFQQLGLENYEHSAEPIGR